MVPEYIVSFGRRVCVDSLGNSYVNVVVFCRILTFLYKPSFSLVHIIFK